MGHPPGQGQRRPAKRWPLRRRRRRASQTDGQRPAKDLCRARHAVPLRKPCEGKGARPKDGRYEGAGGGRARRMGSAPPRICAGHGMPCPYENRAKAKAPALKAAVPLNRPGRKNRATKTNRTPKADPSHRSEYDRVRVRSQDSGGVHRTPKTGDDSVNERPHLSRGELHKQQQTPLCLIGQAAVRLYYSLLIEDLLNISHSTSLGGVRCRYGEKLR